MTRISVTDYSERGGVIVSLAADHGGRARRVACRASEPAPHASHALAEHGTLS